MIISHDGYMIYKSHIHSKSLIKVSPYRQFSLVTRPVDDIMLIGEECAVNHLAVSKMSCIGFMALISVWCGVWKLCGRYRAMWYGLSW